MDLQAALRSTSSLLGGLLGDVGAGRPLGWVGTCPLRQLQKTHGGVGALPYLPPE
jgi:hypothetical protein